MRRSPSLSSFIRASVVVAAAVMAQPYALSAGGGEGSECADFFDWRENDPWPFPDDYGHTADGEYDPNVDFPDAEWYPHGSIATPAIGPHESFEDKLTEERHTVCVLIPPE